MTADARDSKPIPTPAASLDGVRASRDGHQYHEAWAARVALELIPPGTDLAAIAIEGFSPDDQDEMSQEAHDIADLVRYLGGPSEGTATAIEIVQFKYSIARRDGRFSRKGSHRPRG